MRFEGRIYRPPAEADSLLIQATVGCSHNACSFCAMYKDKKFRVRPLAEVREDIQSAAKRWPDARRLFLCDGDALSAGFEFFRDVCQAARNGFPRLRRIASYVNARDIIALSPDQLRELRALGFSLGYLGLESGSAEVLRRIHKGAGPEEMIECVRKAREADIKTSVIGLIGVGGREWSAEHARETARVLNEMRASLLSFLTAIVLEGTPFHAQALRGDFHPLTDRESLVELRDILSRLRLSSCVLRVNHTSNLVNLEGRLPKDQAALINAVEAALPFARDAVSCVWSAAQGQFL